MVPEGSAMSPGSATLNIYMVNLVSHSIKTDDNKFQCKVACLLRSHSNDTDEHLFLKCLE